MNPLLEPGPALDPARIARYSRQLALPGFGEVAQRRLGAARVLVIGAGGLGSAVAPLLAAAGIGTIGVIDDDTVELSNLHRQLSHGVADIGRAKVDSLRDTIRAIDPDIAVDVHRVRATSGSLPGILSSYDLLIDGSDNFATRYLASDAAELAGMPLVWGSILRFQGQVGVSWPGHGPGYRDLFAAPPPDDEVLSCEIGGVLPSLCTAVGSFLATEAIKLITGIGDPLLGRVLFYDALTARTREIAYAVDETRAPVTTLVDAEAVGAPEDGADAAAAVSAAELLRRLRAGEAVRLLDVRGADEAALQRIPGGELLPLPRLLAGEDPTPGGGGGAILVYCAQGPRSQRAVRVLRERGFEAAHLAGGIRAYAGLGGAVEAGGPEETP